MTAVIAGANQVAWVRRGSGTTHGAVREGTAWRTTCGRLMRSAVEIVAPISCGNCLGHSRRPAARPPFDQAAEVRELLGVIEAATARLREIEADEVQP